MAGPLYRFRRAFRFALRGWRVEQETDDEIQFHLGRRVEALVSLGWARDAAEREALRRFGPYDAGRALMVAAAKHREETLTMRERFEGIRQDIGYALRQLRRAPLFTVAVVGSFALGIGANATMFGIIDRLLLRPPAHVVAPDQVFAVGELRLFAGETQWTSGYSYAGYKDYRDHVAAFASVATSSFVEDMDLGRGEHARKVRGMLVSASYFTLTGVRPALGRFILPAEDQESSGVPVAVISHRFWQQEFGGESSALGTMIDMGKRRYTIVGVTPRGFTGLQHSPVDVFIPISAAEGLRYAGDDWATSRNNIWLEVYARLRPGMTAALAEAQGTAMRRPMEAERGRAGDPNIQTSLHSILPRADKEPSSHIRVSKLLVAVSTLVLLVACTNVASL